MSETRLMLFDFASGRWTELAAASPNYLSYPSWTRDNRHVQVRRGRSIVRVQIPDGQVETVASLERVEQVMTVRGQWLGIAPDDSPLLLREISGTTQVYALDVEWPE
jgi:hypothetical protein